MRFRFAAALATALCLSSVHAAAAQTADWTGPYAGLTVTGQTGQDGDVATVIDPALDSRVNYQTRPEGVVVYGEAFDDDIVPGAFVGWRTGVRGLLIGVEGQYQEGGPSTAQVARPEYIALSLACGPGALGCVAGSYDVVTSKVDILRSAALRITAGVPVGDRTLLSAYAGPAILFGRMTMRQDSELTTNRYPVRGVDCFMMCPPLITTSTVTQTVRRSVDETALGVVLGATADVRLTDRFGLRLDAGYARYEALRGTVGGTNGANSEVRAQSASFNLAAGLTFRF